MQNKELDWAFEDHAKMCEIGKQIQERAYAASESEFRSLMIRYCWQLQTSLENLLKCVAKI